MRPLAPKFFLMLLSAALIVWVFHWEQERTLAPPLSQAHAQEADLQSSAGCQECHGDLEGTGGMLRACVVCHEGIGKDLDLGQGLHGAQVGAAVEGGVDDCTLCHIEHAGRDFPLVSEASFRAAGFDSVEEYSHDSLYPVGTAFGLTGAHDGLDCAECHADAAVTFLEKGKQRFRGLSLACDGCHEDSHDGAMLRDCVDCHGQTEKFELHGPRRAGVHQVPRKGIGVFDREGRGREPAGGPHLQGLPRASAHGSILGWGGQLGCGLGADSARKHGL